MTFPIYPVLLRELSDARGTERVLSALCRGPATVDELTRELRIRRPIVKMAISLLRQFGHKIENRGAKGGSHAIKGTYHLIGEPDA